MAHQGFTPWKPTEDSARLVQAVRAVLKEYEKHLPMTGRQIFYRLVATYGYEKSERAANKLYGVLGRARRAGIIPFNVIRDGGSKEAIPRMWANADAFWDDVRDRREHFIRNRQAGQPVYIELFCESPGMMTQLQRVAFQYSVPVYGTRGFTGLGVVAEIAKRALRRDVPTALLQVGDYDPSGESIFESMAGDARTFVRQVTYAFETDMEEGLEGEEAHGPALAEALGLDQEAVEALHEMEENMSLPKLRAERVALTFEQVQEHDLPTAPASKSDSRAKNWVGETCQLEAMPPDLLARTVRDAIEDEMDLARYDEEVKAEAADEAEIDETLPPKEDT